MCCNSLSLINTLMPLVVVVPPSPNYASCHHSHPSLGLKIYLLKKKIKAAYQLHRFPIWVGEPDYLYPSQSYYVTLWTCWLSLLARFCLPLLSYVSCHSSQPRPFLRSQHNVGNSEHVSLSQFHGSPDLISVTLHSLTILTYSKTGTQKLQIL